MTLAVAVLGGLGLGGLGGCQPADLEPCTEAADRTNDGRPIAERYDVIITVSTGDLEALPATGPVRIDGRVDANIRVDRLLVGDQLVTGTQANYGQWTTDVSLQTLQFFREGEFAELMVEAYDVCERPYDTDPVRVRVHAPEGTAAGGLRLRSTPTQTIDGTTPECYLPADGSGLAVAEVTADAASAGVEVTLAAAVAGNFLGTRESRVVLAADETGGGTVARAFFRPTAAGSLGLTASAGPSFEIDESTALRAAAAPAFSGADGAIPRAMPVQVRVATEGRLARCTASTSRPDLITVLGDGQLDLLASDLELGDDPGCGQAQEFTVTFDQAAQVGTAVDLTCEDTYGQATTRTLSAGVD